MFLLLLSCHHCSGQRIYLLLNAYSVQVGGAFMSFLDNTEVQQITLFTLSISTLRAGAEGHGGETGPPRPPPPLTAVALVVYYLSFGSL